MHTLLKKLILTIAEYLLKFPHIYFIYILHVTLFNTIVTCNCLTTRLKLSTVFWTFIRHWKSLRNGGRDEYHWSGINSCNTHHRSGCSRRYDSISSRLFNSCKRLISLKNHVNFLGHSKCAKYWNTNQKNYKNKIECKQLGHQIIGIKSYFSSKKIDRRWTVQSGWESLVMGRQKIA